ncbi:MAG TPA: SDR family oxidoreductase [Terriglobales bacterium]|nr:SDR family oxidoreductase [Terriglobales bacterium]
MSSQKQVILITGSSSGFGRLFAETLAQRGHTVFATMRDPQGRNSAKAAALRATTGIHVFEMDVTDDTSVSRAVDTCLQQFGRIDVAINNAGYGLVGLAETCTTEQVQRIMDTNYLGAVRVNRAVLPAMRRQRSGLLIHISSGAGRLVFPGFGLYCASKFAMEALAEAYRYELAAQGIESCLVEPGAYKTDVFANMVTGSDIARAETYGAAAEVPGRINAVISSSDADPQQVADVVLSIVETPARQRQLRYRVSAAPSRLDEINRLCAEVQSELLERFGVITDTQLTQRSAAAQS